MIYPDLQAELDQLKSTDSLRSLPAFEKQAGPYLWRQGRKLLNLSSNDYLGLAGDETLRAEFFHSLSASPAQEDFGLSASSSRLLTGNHSQYARLEQELSRLFNREDALVFNSGYHANLGILPALAGPGDVIFSDRLNHASILDGARLSGAKLFRYPHLDYAHLATLLAKHRRDYKRAFIVSETLFSMDGDLADLKQLVALKHQFSAWLYLDEAHAFGVLGEKGLGLAEEQGVIPEVDLLVGTFGKALASQGAFVVGDRIIREYLVNKMRPLIFTTGLPPISVHWTHFLLQRLPGLRTHRLQLRELGRLLRAALLQAGLATGGDSQIVPVHIGENQAAVNLAAELAAQGFLLFAIRPPTVPAGTARLRISLTAALNWQDIQSLPKIISESSKNNAAAHVRSI